MDFKNQLELLNANIESLLEMQSKLEQDYNCIELEYILNECIRNIGSNISFLEKVFNYKILNLSPEDLYSELISNWDLLITD